MLNRLSIASKLWVMVIVPLALLGALAALAAWTVTTVRVGGEAYDNIERNQSLIADVLPPPLFLVEGHLASMEAGQAYDPQTLKFDPNEVAQARGQWETAKRAFQDRKNFWLASKERSNIDLDVRRQLEEQVYASGDEMIREIDGELFPTVESGDFGKLQKVEENVDLLYNKHRLAVEKLVETAGARVVKYEADTKSALELRAAIAGGIVALGLAALMFLSFTVARSISVPLKSLTATAKAAATNELPRVVAELQSVESNGDTSMLPSFAVSTSGEVGELAEALNSMQSAAVRLASEQATMRRNVSETFVNLGRRNQNLLNRTLSFITDLEQNERDPDALENLFRLDHLTTRMRRNAESLLVLAGTNPARTWSQPVAMGDVVRSALSEIEAYSRVEYKHVQAVAVRGTAVADIAHLLAELIENAANFSPPQMKVHVAGRLLQDGYVLQVVDSGVGMSSAELADANRRLQTVSDLDANPSKVLGLYVVGRLAARHGLHVTLTKAPTDGVAAVVRVPLNLLETDLGDASAPTATEVAPSVSAVISPLTPLPGAPEPGLAPSASAREVHISIDSRPGPNAEQKSSEVPTGVAPTGTRSAEAFFEGAQPDKTGAEPDDVTPFAMPPVGTSTSRREASIPAPVLNNYVQVVPPSNNVKPTMNSASRPGATTDSGLRRRVRGAQLPDVGVGLAAQQPEAVPDPTQVRSALSDFQRGVTEGRTAGTE